MTPIIDGLSLNKYLSIISGKNSADNVLSVEYSLPVDSGDNS